MSLFAATVEPVGHRKLLTHDPFERVTFNERGEVVLADHGHIYLYLHDGMKYNLARKTPLPDGIKSHCRKAVSDTAIFLHAHYSAPIHQLDITDLHYVGRLHHKGLLLGAIHPGALMYEQRRDNYDFIILLKQPNGEMILQPPGGRKWGSKLSVCSAEEYLVVVEKHTESMDAFTMKGNILLLS